MCGNKAAGVDDAEPPGRTGVAPVCGPEPKKLFTNWKAVQESGASNAIPSTPRLQRGRGPLGPPLASPLLCPADESLCVWNVNF